MALYHVHNSGKRMNKKRQLTIEQIKTKSCGNNWNESLIAAQSKIQNIERNHDSVQKPVLK